MGISKTWSSRWYASKDFPEFVVEDHKIRTYLKERLFHAGISRVEIERAANKAKVRIYTARPGIVIGKRGAEIENLRKDLEKRLGREIIIDIQEIRKPELDAQLVAENVAQQLIRRIAFTFEVAPTANKIEIRQAVEEVFKVKVDDVKTANFRGKKKRYGRFEGRRPHWKKAVVTLAPGESIEFFEGA